MKKFLFALSALLLAAGHTHAQEEGAKLAKSAGKAFTSYNIDPSSNSAKLEEAKQKIDQAVQHADAQALASAWITRGDIYSTIFKRDMALLMVNPNAPMSGDNDALVAFEAYKKAHEVATKNYEKKDALKGIADVQGDLINMGAMKYEARESEKAYLSFNASMQAHDLLKAANQKSHLDEKGKYDELAFYTAAAAWEGNRCPDAMPILENLIKNGINEPAAYLGLYECKLQAGDTTAAQVVLADGRKKFPDDTQLLFAEINAFQAAGKLDELIGRLKTAIDKEPDNVSLYIAMGTTYNELYTREETAKNEAKSGEYFEEAEKYYNLAMQKNPGSVDAVYLLGALYYNKAVLINQEMEAMPADYSAAGQKKSAAAKEKIDALFNQSLPYLQKAESLDPNNLNTLIALNEIYAREDNEIMFTEFKKRLDTVRAGGTNAAPYFNK